MSTSQTNHAITTTGNIDYWSLKLQVRDIEWSKGNHAWIAHLTDYKTLFKGAMKVCIDCVTVHVYHYCDGGRKMQFELCDLTRPVYSQAFNDSHAILEPNSEYVRQAIARTHSRRWIKTPPHGISQERGYDPKLVHHRRHVDGCFLSSSPGYIIQGGDGLGHSIYYRRCDSRFRNLAHQVLKIGRDHLVAADSPHNADTDENSGAPEADTMNLGAQSPELQDERPAEKLRSKEDTSTRRFTLSAREQSSSREEHDGLKGMISRKRKRED